MVIYGCSFLELDVLYITIQNEFQWIGGDKNEMSAVHMEILTVAVSLLHVHASDFEKKDIQRRTRGACERNRD
jgi:hypothetical protein